MTNETRHPDDDRKREPPIRRGLFIASVVFAVAFVVAVIGGGAVLLALLASGNPEISKTIVSAINGAIGTDSTQFVCKNVRGQVFGGASLEQPRLVVLTPDGPFVWARASRVRVQYDLLGLLFGKSRSFHVALDSLAVNLAHDRNGNIVMPRFATRPAPQGSGRETRITVAVRGGAFTYDRAEIAFGSIRGQGEINLGPGRSSLLVRNLEGQSAKPGRPGPMKIDGLLVAERGILRADPLEIGVGRSKVRSQVEWDLSAARVREGKLELEPLQLGEVLRVFDVADVDGVLRGEVEFAGTPADGTARACLAGTFEGEPIDTLLVDARSKPGSVALSGFRLRVRGAEATGKGVFETSGALHADLNVRGLNPAVLPWTDSDTELPDGSLSGQVRIEAHRTKPRPEATFVAVLEPGRLGKVTLNKGRLRVRMERNGAVSLDSAWVDIPGGRLAADGVLGPDRSLRASARAVLYDLAPSSPLLAPLVPTGGRGRLAVDFDGSLDRPTFHGQAHLFDGRFDNGLACDTLTVEAQGALRPELNLTADVGIQGLEAGGRPLGNVDAIARGGRTLHIDRYVQAIGDTVLTLKGSVAFGEGTTTATVDSLSLAAAEHRIQTRAPAKVVFLEKHLSVSGLTLDLDPGTLQADLDWNPGKGTIDARGTLDGLDLERVPELKRSGIAVGGRLRGEVLASGKIDDPDLSLRLSVARPAVERVVGDSLTLSLDYAPGVLTIDRADWMAGGSRLAVTGSARPRFTIEEWWRALGRKDRSWAGRVALALEATAESFELGRIAPADTVLKSLSGTATLRAKLSGTPAEPIIALEGKAPEVRFRDVSGEIPAVVASYERGRLTIERFDARSTGRSTSSIRGSLPINLALYAPSVLRKDDSLSLHAEIPDADLAIIPILLPELAAAAGRFSLSADAAGTPAHPRITGVLHVTKGRLRFAGREEILDQVAIDATFDETRLELTKATAQQGKKGRLSATGFWKWSTTSRPPEEPSGFGPRGEYSMKVKATDFTVTDRETYLMRVSGEFDVRNALDLAGAEVPSVVGHATVSKGELTLDLSKPPGDPGEPLPLLYYVTVDVPGNFFYRNLDAEVELESDGDLTFRNEGESDIALGVLQVRGGKYYVVTRQFGNLSGVINFNSPDRIDPEVDVRGETSLGTSEGSTKTVYLALSDRVSRLKVRVYDDENTPANDLWKALAFGVFVPTSGFQSGGGSGNGNEAAGVALPITNYLFQNVERWLGGAGFVDTIDLRSSASSGGKEATGAPVSVVGVGKYVTPQLYVKYSRDFSGDAGEQIDADYRVTRFLLLKGQQIRRPDDQTNPQEYNVDLKVRLEY
jgi:autotransporter translocation and assembly factor TamB